MERQDNRFGRVSSWGWVHCSWWRNGFLGGGLPVLAACTRGHGEACCAAGEAVGVVDEACVATIMDFAVPPILGGLDFWCWRKDVF